MKTIKKLNNLNPQITKSETLEIYKDVQYLDILDIWGNRSYHWIGANGHQNSANSIVVFRHCVDTEPNTPKYVNRLKVVNLTNVIRIVLIIIIALVLTGLVSQAQTLTSQERNAWNGFVSHLDSVGMRGSVELDKHTLSMELFNKYTKGTIEYTTFVTRVQTDLQIYRANALKQIKAGKAVFTGTDAEFMPGLSVVDGWAGSMTTTYKFPSDSVKVYNVYKLVNTKYNNTYARQ